MSGRVYVLYSTYLIPISPHITLRKNRPVEIDIPDVEQLNVFQSMRPAPRQVRRHVVQLAETSREGDVSLVVEVGVAEDADAVLEE